MKSEIRTLDDIELWRRPTAGALAPASRWTVIAACALSIVVAVIGPRLLWTYEGRSTDAAGWFGDIVVLGLLAWILVAFGIAHRVSRLLRVAVALPLAHVTAMAIAWGGVAATDLVRVERMAPMLDTLPIWLAVALCGSGSVVVALIAAHGRRGEAPHAFVVMALVHLLVLGLWLPIAAWACGPREATARIVDGAYWLDTGMVTWGDRLYLSPWLIPIVLVPAFVVAAACTVVAIRRRVRWPRLALASVAVLALIGMAARHGAPIAATRIYDNFSHVLFALAFVAVIAIVALGVAIWLRPGEPRASARTWCAGTIAADDELEIVGCHEIAGWLRGPRALLRPFTLVTAAGSLAIPSGARLIARPPLISSALRRGESAVVLRAGDRVIVGGFVEHDDDAGHPFRTTSMLVPGPRGLVVRPLDGEGPITSALLVLWRPCLAYLVIVSVVALPALAALFGASR